MYEKEGLKVQLVPFRTCSEVVGAANKNQIDVGYCEITPVTSAIYSKFMCINCGSVNERNPNIFPLPYAENWLKLL
jgi:hypothetical protein